jgi:hypothetical protein
MVRVIEADQYKRKHIITEESIEIHLTTYYLTLCKERLQGSTSFFKDVENIENLCENCEHIHQSTT